jgi:hypothetical protein
MGAGPSCERARGAGWTMVKARARACVLLRADGVMEYSLPRVCARYGADGKHAGNMTNIPDDVSNLNCGTLPDGRNYLLSNVRMRVGAEQLSGAHSVSATGAGNAKRLSRSAVCLHIC